MARVRTKGSQGPFGLESFSSLACRWSLALLRQLVGKCRPRFQSI